MAGQSGLKGFYIGIAVVAVGGIGAIWWARQSSANAGGPTEVGPLPVAGVAFPGYTMGSDSAPVEIIEYGDFQCPACAQFSVLTVPDVKQRLVATGRVRWTFRDFPLESHPNAMPAHLAAACSGEQGQFWAMHDLLYFRHNEWALERRPARRFKKFAESIGLDVDRYEECMDSRRYAGRILATKRDGAALGVGSTPTLIVGNMRIPGAISYDSVRAIVDNLTGGSE